MRKLSIYILCLVVLLVLIFVVAPYYVGSTVHSQLNRHITKLEKTHPNLKIKILDYKKQWYQSDITLQITHPFALIEPPVPSGKETNFTTTVYAHIKHGPFVIYKGNDGKTHYRLAKAAITLTGDNKYVNGSITSIIHWNNTINASVDLKRLALQSPGHSLLVNNLTGTYEYSPSQKTLDYHLQASKLSKAFIANEADGETLHMKSDIENINKQVTLNKHDGIWYGSRTTHAAQMTESARFTSVRGGGKPSIVDTLLSNIQDGQTNLNLTRQAGKATLTIQKSAKKVQFQQQNFGALNLEFSVTGLDTAALSTLSKRFETLREHSAFSASGGAKLIGPLSALLQKGFSVNLKHFSLKSESGTSTPVTANTHIQMQPVTDTASVMAYIQALSAKGEITLPRETALQGLKLLFQNVLNDYKADHHTIKETPTSLATNMLRVLIKDKILILKNGILSMQFSFEKGQLLINGKKPDFKHLRHWDGEEKSQNTVPKTQTRKGFFFR